MILWPWLHQGDSSEVLPQLPAELAHAMVTDPPAGISFMGRDWDSDKGGRDSWVRWLSGVMGEARRVCRPGAPALVWALPRTAHWTARAMEDAGWIVEDVVLHVFGSGFPKSTDMAKSIDRMRHDMDELLVVTRWLRAARGRAGVTNAEIDAAFGLNGMAGHWCAGTRGGQPLIPTLEQVPQLLHVLGLQEPEVPDEVVRLLVECNGYRGDPGDSWHDREVVGEHRAAAAAGIWYNRYTQDEQRELSVGKITTAASDDAKRWRGWGTALKPSAEHWVLARAPGPPAQVGTARVKYAPKAVGADACRDYNEHPTVKHTSLMAALVELVTEPGEVVLDPFMGSGTTGVACARRGRRFVGVELEQASYDTAVRRLVDQGEQRTPDRTTRPRTTAPRRRRVLSASKKGGVL